jgi:SAM-dependent methyltransferase
MRDFWLRRLRRVPVIKPLWDEYERMLRAHEAGLAERDAALMQRDAAVAKKDATLANAAFANRYTCDLVRFVKNEAFLWGDNATKAYFEPVEAQAEGAFAMVQDFLRPHPIDYTTTMELSCGHGRNSELLASLASHMILVDVAPDNIAFCKDRFSDKPWRFVVNNGFDLRAIEDETVTFVHWFEAAVHCDIEIILSYLKEFRRVMVPGGYGFVHHSNVTAYPGEDFRNHPAWRNFMSKEIFAHLTIHNGLNIDAQFLFDQGGPAADCFTLFHRPARL